VYYEDLASEGDDACFAPGGAWAALAGFLGAPTDAESLRGAFSATAAQARPELRRGRQRAGDELTPDTIDFCRVVMKKDLHPDLYLKYPTWYVL